ncbi:MAG: tRNA (N6-isopentenyl adenosine(37)-C2)-methylthiotransferase MiaB [Desulfobacterales bacterium]|nr:tRNA (N6-isopentenyl adenosine(37)-C2)-methylthiotransferase MiaB [Desulfobacterales bacterium]
MNAKYFYLHTIGCQMNVYDSEQIAIRLATLGYEQTASMDRADLIIVNTCTVRAKAEQKAFSLLGRLAGMKRNKRRLIIGVGGCVAQQEGQKILERMPCIDFVFGTQAIDRLPGMIQQIEARRCRIVDVHMDEAPDMPEFLAGTQAESQVSKFVTIMRGCDNYCAYCVVPFVRGRETSREPQSILREIRALVENGVREVTLLGQNVNSYGKKQNLDMFPELLARINEIEGLLRIRFTTSHPKDLSSNLIAAFRDLDKLCPHIHLPVQSGSNRVLKRMNRKYTKEQYLDKVAKLRDTCSEIAITSDMIVGFPGETEADFEQTLELVKTVEYDGLFAFQYSDRPRAPSVKLPHKISEPLKRERLQTLLDLQEKFTKRKNKVLVGSTQLILTDGLSKKQVSGEPESTGQALQWTGRTITNKIVNFYMDELPANTESLSGKLIGVRIDKAFSHSLFGKAINAEPSAGRLKGVENYAA